MPPIVIFSIGNPGAITRHSIGHLALKGIIEHLGAKQLIKHATFSATTCNNVALVKSNVYMNESDKALRKYFNDRSPSGILIIVYDNFDLDLSKVKLSKLKPNSSHNGLRSVARFVNTDNVYTLGIGIGPKPSNGSKDTMADWVLSPVRANEREILESKSFPLVLDYIDYIIETEDIGDVNKVNSYVSKRK